MESAKNAKRRRRTAATDEEGDSARNAYYKTLRGAQKKRRMERKRKGVVQHQEMKESHVVRPSEDKTNDLPREPDDHSLSATKKAEQSRKYLPRGKQMVSASLKTAAEPVSQKKVTTQAAMPPKPREASTSKSIAGVMEIDPANVKRATGSKPIGRGTFGTCSLATYRGIKVVVKEYKKTTQVGSTSKLKREAINEAQIIRHLGDHPGIPFLIGVMLKSRSVHG